MAQHEQFKQALGWLGFLAFFSVLNETVFNVSLPDIAVQFAITPGQANWINTAFLLSFAIGSILYAQLADFYPLKKLLVIGLFTYSGGSLIGFILHSQYEVMIAARFIQGAGAAAVPALIMVMVARYAGEHRGKAFGLIGSVVALGEGTGPALGGVIAQYLHWSYLFALPIFTLLPLPFILRVLPRESLRAGAVDRIGALVIAAGIIMFTLFTTTYHGMYLGGAICLLILFGWHIRRVHQPFLEPALFTNRKFVAAVSSGCILLGTVAGFISMVPYMMRELHQLSTAAIGSGVLLPGTLSVILFGYIGGHMVDKKGSRTVLLTGAAAIVVALVSLAALMEWSPWIGSAALVVMFGGLSFVKTAISESAAGSLPERQAGSGMGLLSFACFLAEGVGIAFIGGLLTNRVAALSWWPSFGDAYPGFYSKITMLAAAAIVAGALLFCTTFQKKK
ncbi:MFS transporter [Paenibacillus sp. GCM10027626]|uniref:MFS transporter n=1 Tax=Paenibacillus sp. GCM10027626 TaxID=3273411 RepID=UPI003625565F